MTKRRRSWRLLSAVLALDAVAVLPVGLVGALAVQVELSMSIGETGQGTAVGGFFLAGAVAAALTRSRIDRWGWRRSSALAATATTSSLLGIGTLAHGAVTLAAFLAVGGVGLAIMMPATNALVASRISPARVGMAVLLKQMSVPIALLVAGAFVPLFALPIGWRWCFIGVAALAPAALLLVPAPRLGVGPQRPPRPPGSAPEAVPRRQALVLGAGLGLASVPPSALMAFLVLSLVDGGFGEATAALLFGVANGAGLAVRLLAGVLANVPPKRGFAFVSVMVWFGGGGAVLIATGQPDLMLLGSLLAFGMGWGWPGLLFALVVRSNAAQPARASAVVQAGAMAGSALGPVFVGFAIQAGAGAAAWLLVAAAAAGGGTLIRASSPEAASTAPSP